MGACVGRRVLGRGRSCRQAMGRRGLCDVNATSERVDGRPRSDGSSGCWVNVSTGHLRNCAPAGDTNTGDVRVLALRRSDAGSCDSVRMDRAP